MHLHDDVELYAACRLIDVYCGGRFYDLWQLAGPAKASCRAHVMSTLLARKVPQGTDLLGSSWLNCLF
jgi:hypothetical protein